MYNPLILVSFILLNCSLLYSNFSFCSKPKRKSGFIFFFLNGLWNKIEKIKVPKPKKKDLKHS